MHASELLGVFADESRDLLVQMEDILLRAERGALDTDDTHALFRCAHTIKGSAGMFGFDTVVRFTHEVESVLDGLRKNTLILSHDLINLLLECQDYMARSIVDVLAGVTPDMSVEERLTACLHVFHVTTEQTLPMGAPGSLIIEDEALAESLLSATAADCKRWQLSLRFDTNVLFYGNDPFKMIRYLQEIGEIVQLETLTDALPALQDADPESCYLGFEITLISQAPLAEIEEVFVFVADIARIRIAPCSDVNINVADATYVAVTAPSVLAPSPITQSSLAQPSLAQSALASAPTMQVIPAALSKTPASSVTTVADTAAKPVIERRATDLKYVKVPSERLDALIDQVGEMVIAGAAAQLKVLDSRHQDLQETIAHLMRLLEDVRDTALCLRMTPIGEVFQRFPRVVRDLARELGKDIELVIQGADTELDKSMVEKIADPLMHLVRNSLDHGIETPEKRLAAGKAAKGTLSLTASHESGSIIIEVKDNGAGLDCTRIRQKAIERRLIAADAVLSDPQVWRLILEPGFSTAEQITNVSGRGVGMDVVKTAIESLRGSLDIDSIPGAGTTMRVSVPLTLAIIDGFQVEVGNNTFILPLDAVQTCIECAPEQERSDCINLRGDILPVVRLPALFDLNAGNVERNNIVVVRFAGRQAAIEVDRLKGECQAVIKPLGPLFENLRGIAGSTILGSGEIALVLDIPQLIQVASGFATRNVNSAMRSAVEPLH